MIAVQIFGGLGNQMFQFAAGTALARHHGVDLVINTRFYDTGQPTELDFRLDRFSLTPVEADRTRLPARLRDGLGAYLAGKFRRPDFTAYHEPHLAFDPNVATLPDQTYLCGYWQCARYFDAIAPEIRDLFTLRDAPAGANYETLEAFQKTVPVSLHIRRGAFVSNPKFYAVHGTCNMDYYHRAAEYIAERAGRDITIYAFSDEPDWVAENLKLPFKMEVVAHNGLDHNYEDIRLMRHCRHHIIANSSFSWWGAWLNPDPGKIVVAPSRWFADAGMQDHDILVPEWITL